MFFYLLYLMLSVIFLPFMTTKQTVKNLHWSLLHMCLAMYAELYRHVKISLLKIFWTQHVIPFAHWSVAFLSIYTQPWAFSSKLVILFFFSSENNLLLGKKIFLSQLNRREKGSRTAHVQSSLFSESLQNIILIFFCQLVAWLLNFQVNPIKYPT